MLQAEVGGHEGMSPKQRPEEGPQAPPRSWDRGAELARAAVGLHAPHPQGHALHPYVQLLPGESPGMGCVRRGTVPCVPPARWSLSINFKRALDQALNSQLSRLNGLPGQALL